MTVLTLDNDHTGRNMQCDILWISFKKGLRERRVAHKTAEPGTQMFNITSSKTYHLISLKSYHLHFSQSISQTSILIHPSSQISISVAKVTIL
jgi:hypothetical protein